MQNPSDASVRFNAEGHLCGTQWWTVDYPGRSVRLIVAFRAADNVKVIGVDIPASLNCQTFFKHCLIPSKSGRTVRQKALFRAKHRKAATTLYATDASAHKIITAAMRNPKKDTWARDTNAWKNAVEAKRNPTGTLDDWKDFKAAAAQDMEDLQGTVLSWHDKYGTPEQKVQTNTVLLLNEVRVHGSNLVRSWPNPDGLAPLQPVTPLYVAGRLATVLEDYKGWEKMCEGWVQTAAEVVITFDQACVLVVSAGNEKSDGDHVNPPHFATLKIEDEDIVAPRFRYCSAIKIRAARPTKASNVHDYVVTHLASHGPLLDLP